jgi:hypothetical protein
MNDREGMTIVRTRRPHRLSRPVAAVVAAGLLATACGSASASSPPHPTLSAVSTPSPTVWPTASLSDPVDLVTYEPDSACASVQTTTSIDKVPAACAAAWKPYGVREVPGQDALKRTPHFPNVLAPNGVGSTTATRLAIALWRMETFEAFALGTRQLRIVDGLGRNYLFRAIGVMEKAVAQGDRVSTPLCHFFPTQIRIIALAHDFASYVHRPDGFLGVEATYTGPCYATATDKTGKTSQLFRFDGQRKVVYVGDIGKGDPMGPVLVLTTLGECDQAVVKATCAQ